jgi:hypothetical protein
MSPYKSTIAFSALLTLSACNGPLMQAVDNPAPCGTSGDFGGSITSGIDTSHTYTADCTMHNAAALAFIANGGLSPSPIIQPYHLPPPVYMPYGPVYDVHIVP